MPGTKKQKTGMKLLLFKSYRVVFKTSNLSSSIKYTPTTVMSCFVVCLLLYSGGGDGSLDRLLPSVSTGLSPRKRTTSQCKSEPPLLRTNKRTIYTAGRPPWYNEHGAQSKEAFVIGRTLKRYTSHNATTLMFSFLLWLCFI